MSLPFAETTNAELSSAIAAEPMPTNDEVAIETAIVPSTTRRTEGSVNADVARMAAGMRLS